MSRLLAAVVAAALSALPALAVVGHAYADSTNNGGPGLDWIGWIHASDLTDATGAPVTTAVQVVGDDGAGGTVLYVASGNAAVIDVDAQTLHETEAIAAPLNMKSMITDPASHRVFLGSGASGLCTLPIQTLPTCTTAGPDAVPPQLAAINVADKSSAVYSFPPSTAGQSVIGMQMMHPTGQPSVLLALLYATTDPSVAFTQGTSHTMTLYALDPDKLASTDPNAAVLWNYPISNCASTPSWTLKQRQDFLGTTPDGRSAYFACRGLSFVGTNTTVQPAGAELVSFDTAFPTKQTDTSAFSTQFIPNGSDASFSLSGGDETNGMLYIASSGLLTKAAAFDAVHRAWTGSVPFPSGAYGQGMDAVATDPSNGRAYAIYSQSYVVSLQGTQVPVPQGAALSLGDLVPAGTTDMVEPSTHRLFIAASSGRFTHACGQGGGCPQYPADDTIAVYEDSRPLPTADAGADPDSLTHDIPITSDTPIAYGAFASGYGAKATFVGGVHSVSDLASNDASINEGKLCAESQSALCVPSTSDGNRTFIFGAVNHTEISNSGASAVADPVAVDTTTQADSTSLTAFNPASGITPADGPQPPPPPPAPGAVAQQLAPATCSDFNDVKKTDVEAGATVSCDHGAGTSTAGAAAPGQISGAPVRVAYAGSATQVANTADNQTVTTAIAEARGIVISIPAGPTISIGDVITTAATVSGGRPGTAQSTFSRRVSEVTVTDPSGAIVGTCGFKSDATPNDPSGSCDPRQLTDLLSTQAESPVQFIEPKPDANPTVAGSPGGAQAEVIKSPYTYWNDYFTDGDSGFEVPGLQVILVGDQNQPSRLVLNLAAVHVESHYAIGLLPPPPPPLPDPTLKLSLTDGSLPPVPLAGGEFALVADDGTSAGTCSTAADGIGSCSFSDVKPGNYTIKETKAPPGYAIAPDYQLSLDPGQDYTATFVNLLAIGAVHVSLTSAVDKKPLSGAVFAMYAGSSTLGTPVATCTTGKDGTCGFTKVSLASYTMHQQTAPRGFLAATDFPFDLTDPGQDATLTFVDGTPAVKAVQGKFIPGKPAVPPHTEVVGGGGQGLPAVPAAYTTGGDIPPVLSSAPSEQAPIVAGLPQRLAQLPAQLAKLLTHSPQQAVLLLFMWLVFGMPIYLWARRRQLLSATEGT